MSKYLLTLTLLLALSTASYAAVVGDFEDVTLDGWWSNDATLSQGMSGVTLGSSSMQIDAPGGWKMAALMSAVPNLAALGSGADIGATATISLDITIADADTDGTWINSEIVINAQNNDDNGANNNLGWTGLGGQDLVVDGAPHNYEWTITPALRDAIAGADDTIGWFEVVIVTNNDANSITLQVDNVQINEPATDAVVGNFEDETLDGWTSDATISQGTVGVTLDSASLKVDAAGGWQAVGKLDAKPWKTLIGSGPILLSADITVIDADVVGASWMNVEMVINGQGDGGYTLGWNPLGGQDAIRDGAPHTYTWSINQLMADKIAANDDNIGWFEIFIVANNDATSVVMYIDNVRIYQPEPVGNEPSGLVIGDFETDVDGWWLPGDATAIITQTTAAGATSGTGALLIEDGAGWKGTARLDAKPYRTILGSEGAKITMDVTASPEDVPGGWLNMEVVINAQNNDDNGANNNIGWVGLGQQGTPIDGQPSTITWELPEDLRIAISQTDDTIGWFELVIIKNSGDVAKIYVDNIAVWPAPEPPSYPYGYLIGDFEIGMDNWGANDATLSQSETGATLGSMALRSEVPTGWHMNCVLSVTEYFDVFAAGARLVADITVLPEDYDAGWGNIEMLINSENIGWRSLGTKAPIVDGEPHTYLWELDDALRSDIKNGTPGGWFEIFFITNSDASAPVYYLDNIWIFIPEKATYPSPANGATDIDVLTPISWLAGGGGIEHDVFIGTDLAAISNVNRDNIDAYPNVTYILTEETTLDLPRFDLSTTYYWRVDEIEDSNNIVTGDIWNFTVTNNINLEDFESYTDYADLTATWNDANELSTDIAHQGAQAMMLYADNRKAPYYAEATLTLPDHFADMTDGDMGFMELFFYGDPNNAPEQFYARLEDSQGNSAIKAYPGDPADITKEEWQIWRITLADFLGVNLADVATLSIGFGDPDFPAAGGKVWEVYVDDIRLFPARCILELRDPAFAAIDYAPIGVNPGDCVINYSELAILVSDWLMTDAILPTSIEDPNEEGGRVAIYTLDIGSGTEVIADSNDPTPEGTLNGSATWVSPGYDGTGYAVNFDGSNGRIDLGTWDPSEGTGHLGLSAWIRWSGDLSVDHQGIIGKRSAWGNTNAMRWFLETDPLGRLGFRQYWEAGVDLFSEEGILNPFIGKWAHVAVSFDGTDVVIYLNGAEVASGPFVLADMPDAGIGIGNTHGGGGGETFSGDIDEVQIYNRALSAEEVAYLADLTKGDGQLDVPIASVADISSDEPAGQKSINLKDFAVLASYWLEKDMAVVFE